MKSEFGFSSVQQLLVCGLKLLLLYNCCCFRCGYSANTCPQQECEDSIGGTDLLSLQPIDAATQSTLDDRRSDMSVCASPPQPP